MEEIQENRSGGSTSFDLVRQSELPVELAGTNGPVQTPERNPSLMWCSRCRTDVSVRTTGHAGGLLCSRCGHDLLAATRPADAIRQAREILERWNSSDLFERISRTESLDALQTRLEAIKKPDQSTGALANIQESDEANQNAPAIGPSLPLTILKHPLTVEDLASISPKHYRDADAAVPQRPEDEAEAVTTQDVSTEDGSTEDGNTDGGNTDGGTEDGGTLSLDLQQAVDPHDLQDKNDQDENDEHQQTSQHCAVSDAEIAPPADDTREVNLLDSHRANSDFDSMNTSVPVTTEGITSELQRVYELALAQELKLQTDALNEMVLATSDWLPDENTDAAMSVPPLMEDASELPSSDDVADGLTASDATQSIQPVPAVWVASYADSKPCPPKPAETANVSELQSAAMPTKIIRSPVRRPLLHRRFQMERPATTSSTGSEKVNRKLRVDQPGSNHDDSESTQQDAAPITSSVAPEAKIVSNSPKPGRRMRIDGPESLDAVTGTDGRRGRTQTLPKHRYSDDAHDSAMRGPHFEITPPRRSNLTSVTGQFLAYLGVLGLTIGTAMVIYGHFGGYSEYTPTGWLVTTVAQMLLFLGVINLVSGGIEQNNDDVSRRINTLGEQLLRIEQVTTDVLKGPKLSARLYDDPNAEVEETSRDTANVQRD